MIKPIVYDINIRSLSRYQRKVKEPGSIFNVSFGTMLTLSSQIKLVSIKEVRCPYFKLTFVTKGLVKGAGYSLDYMATKRHKWWPGMFMENQES